MPSGWGSKAASIGRLQKHGAASHLPQLLASVEAAGEAKARIAEEKAAARKEKAKAAREAKKATTKRRRKESEDEDSDDSYEN